MMIIRTLIAAAGLLTLFASAAHAAHPALTTEISPQHPLLLFAVSAPDDATPEQYAANVTEAYGLLAGDLKPFAACVVRRPAATATDREAFYRAMLPPLQEAGIPVVLDIDGNVPRDRVAAAQVEGLVSAFTIVAGIQTSEPRFDIYPAPGQVPAPPLNHAWFHEVSDAAARYGRFTHLVLEGMQWPRLQSNTTAAGFRAKLRAAADYIIPSLRTRGDHQIPGRAALAGLWLEGAAARWGLEADARWIVDAGYTAPGQYAHTGSIEGAGKGFYPACIYSGAMAGAQVYAFARPEHLWVQDNPTTWEAEILPALRRVLSLGAIAPKEFVRKKARVGYRLAPADTPAAFQANLQDIDPVLDTGVQFQAAYGGAEPGRVLELVPDRSDRYLVPLLSADAAPELDAAFASVYTPGALATLEAWNAALDQYAQQDGSGAYVSKVGRGIFVLHPGENDADARAFTVNQAPAPVGPLTAKREETTVTLSWPLREGDVSYAVYRRLPPADAWTLLANGVAEQVYADPAADAGTAYAYAVTALTSEMEPYTGTLAPGEHQLLSAVESRIRDEVVLAPGIAEATSVPPPAPPAAASVEVIPPPADPEAPADPIVSAQAAIIARMASWESSVETGALDAVTALYDPAYADAQGWGWPYARRAWRAFFDGVRRPLMHTVLREWDTAAIESGVVRTRAFVHVTGIAPSDPLGIVADVPIHLSRSDNQEFWITWTQREGAWYITSTDPQLPNLRDLLSYTASPYADLNPGPDTR